MAENESSDMKTCPMCAEEILEAALICKHCKHDFRTGMPAATAVDANAPVGAGLGSRFLARLIDGLILAVLSFVLAAVLFFIPGSQGSLFATGGALFTFSLGALIFGIITVGVTIGYFAYMESSRGQTFGKMALHLETQGPDGGRPTMEQAVKRNLWYAISIVPFIGGVLQFAAVIGIVITISTSETNTGWHDDFAGGTRVVKIG